MSMGFCHMFHKDYIFSHSVEVILILKHLLGITCEISMTLKYSLSTYFRLLLEDYHLKL